MKNQNFEKRPRDIHQMNHYAKKGFSMSKNEATVQQTAITKKIDEITKEIEKIKGYNSAKK